MTKYLYGEYRWNVRFQKGMKALRSNKTSIRDRFEIRTNDAIHKFRRIGDFVERVSNYFSRVFMTRKRERKYAYYELSSGRRVCPEHRERLVGMDELSRYERKCPVKGCDYQTEPYGIQPCEAIAYTQEFEKIAENTTDSDTEGDS